MQRVDLRGRLQQTRISVNILRRQLHSQNKTKTNFNKLLVVIADLVAELSFGCSVSLHLSVRLLNQLDIHSKALFFSKQLYRAFEPIAARKRFAKDIDGALTVFQLLSAAFEMWPDKKKETRRC